MTTQMTEEIQNPPTDGRLTGEALQAENAKRQWLFTRQPLVILVGVLAMGDVAGLRWKQRDDEEVANRTIAEALKRNLNPRAVRGNEAPPDSGIQIFKKEEGVRTTHFMAELTGRGYSLVDQYQERNPNQKGPKQTLVYVLEPNSPVRVVMNPTLHMFLNMWRWNHCTVWGNPKTDKETGKSHRLDTVNLAKARDVNEPYRSLHIGGKAGTVYNIK